MELIWMAALVLVPASVAIARAAEKAEKRAALAHAAARKSRR